MNRSDYFAVFMQTKTIKNKVHREDKLVYPYLRAKLLDLEVREKQDQEQRERDALNPRWLQDKNRTILFKHHKKNQKRKKLGLDPLEPPAVAVMKNPPPSQSLLNLLLNSCVPFKEANERRIRKRMKPEESDSGESDSDGEMIPFEVFDTDMNNDDEGEDQVLSSYLEIPMKEVLSILQRCQKVT